MTDSNSRAQRRERLTELMSAAGCVKPKPWVSSELSEDIPQFARFLMLKSVHEIADDVDVVLSNATWERPDLTLTMDRLRHTVPAEDLHVFLRAYAKAMGNLFVTLLDHGPDFSGPGVPGWLLMETDEAGETTDRAVEGLCEDYLDFEANYRSRAE